MMFYSSQKPDIKIKTIDLKRKPKPAPVPKYILAIKDQCLKLWPEVRDGINPLQPPLDHKIAAACRLTELCGAEGDRQAAENLMQWVEGQIPLIPKDGQYTREFAMLEMALAYWRQGLPKPADAWANKLPGSIRDIYLEEAAFSLRKRGEYQKGWQMISRSSKSFYQVLYLKCFLTEHLGGKKPPLDVPKLLSKLMFQPGEERGFRVYTLMLKYQCWLLLKNPDRAEDELERAMAEQGKYDPLNMEERIEALRDKLEIAKGYFGLGRQQRGKELLKWDRMEHELLHSLLPVMNGTEEYIREKLDGRLAELMALEIQYGRESLAWGLLEKTLTEYGEGKIYLKAGQAYLEQRRYKKALWAGGRIKNDYSRVKYLTELAEKCSQDKMKTLSNRAFKLAVRYAKAQNRWGLWLLLAKAAGNMGDRNNELKYLTLAKNCILKGEPSQFNSLGHLVKRYCRAGQFYLALKLAGQDPEPLWRLRSLIDVWRHYRKKNA